jgi:hypothetical protein
MKDWFSEEDNADVFADWFIGAFDKMSDEKKAEITNRITSR